MISPGYDVSLYGTSSTERYISMVPFEGSSSHFVQRTSRMAVSYSRLSSSEVLFSNLGVASPLSLQLPDGLKKS